MNVKWRRRSERDSGLIRASVVTQLFSGNKLWKISKTKRDKSMVLTLVHANDVMWVTTGCCHVNDEIRTRRKERIMRESRITSSRADVMITPQSSLQRTLFNCARLSSADNVTIHFSITFHTQRSCSARGWNRTEKLRVSEWKRLVK